MSSRDDAYGPNSGGADPYGADANSADAYGADPNSTDAYGADGRNDGRHETVAQRLDRNWDEILQELRVLQTGTQILTGFLLTVAFSARFEDLNEFQVNLYLVLVLLAVITTAVGLAPVSLHRMLFRKRAKKQIVDIANILLRSGLVGVALVISGVAMLVFDVVTSRTAGIVAAVVTLIVIVLAWLILPLLSRPRRGEQRQ
ncbi:DUF6328 family protein [Planctomonas psychrotolerans]|uniref:DUF6328 family protein n=1 Tax=Planctomonas psychrotolerans TaxID=2528712 RepID=UPI0029D40E9A|nr:DUF6328 family protein [Planctomonas psychrotolerans]